MQAAFAYSAELGDVICTRVYASHIKPLPDDIRSIAVTGFAAAMKARAQLCDEFAASAVNFPGESLLRPSRDARTSFWSEVDAATHAQARKDMNDNKVRERQVLIAHLSLLHEYARTAKATAQSMFDLKKEFSRRTDQNLVSGLADNVAGYASGDWTRRVLLQCQQHGNTDDLFLRLHVRQPRIEHGRYLADHVVVGAKLLQPHALIGRRIV